MKSQPSGNKILQILFNHLGKQGVGHVHCMAWQHLTSAQQKWNNSAGAGFSHFNITFFIAM